MKKICRCISGTIRKFFKETINGTKGVVSLFLAIIMLPLLSLSLLLVEFSRYQSVIQLMNEISDISAFSTLAEYDTFLEERFGLLAVSQEKEIKDTFAGYLDANIGSIGKSITVTKNNAEGGFALSDTDVLKQQLLECSEISAVSEALIKGLTIEDLFKKISKCFDFLKNFNDKIKKLNAAAEISKALVDLMSHATDAKNEFENKYKPALRTCRLRYRDFEEKTLKWIDALKAAESNLVDGQDPNTVYDDVNVQASLEEIKVAGKRYKNAVKHLKDELKELKEDIAKMYEAFDKIKEASDKYDEAMKEINKSDPAEPNTNKPKPEKPEENLLSNIVGTVIAVMSKAISGNFEDMAHDDIDALEKLLSKLQKLFGGADLANEDAIKKTITSDWTLKKIKKEYGLPEIKSIQESFFETISEGVIDYLKGNAEGNKTLAYVRQIFKILNGLFGIEGIYDTNLNSVIKASFLYDDNIGLSFSAKALITAFQKFSEALGTLSKPLKLNLLKLFTAFAKIVVSGVAFIAALVTWVGEILVRVTHYLFHIKDVCNYLMLFGYGAYNLPNRMTVYDKKTLSGDYEFMETYILAGGSSYTAQLGGDFPELYDLAGDNIAACDCPFKGAEGEYILVGSNSEIYNQSVSFLYLYFFRLIFDLFSVISKTPGEVVIKIAAAIVEPLIDTIILVNGGKSCLIKTVPYMSPQGLPILLEDAIDISPISHILEQVKDMFNSKPEPENGGEVSSKPKPESEDKGGLLKVKYTEHLLFLFMLMMDEKIFLKRMQNIIQTEAAAYFNSNSVYNIDFNLNRTYTYIQTDVEYTLNPLFNVAGLLDNGLFTVSSKRYSGY